MINNITIEYQDGTVPEQERETLFRNSLQMWLRPFSEEINMQNGKLVLCFSTEGSNGFRLEGVTEDLQEKVASRFPTFVRG
jgi:hypothetical protein